MVLCDSEANLALEMLKGQNWSRSNTYSMRLSLGNYESNEPP